ncbi:hypothetical protein STAQ_49970 [Allostella sp. ATCC 35155]|nr:hypothetical protein STAQ_49970 [Stella sp. ATCC 35155]
MEIERVRQILVDALEIGSVAAIYEPAIRGPFLSGEDDLSFDRLDMDSLARMELCIAIEVETGVSLTPDDLDSFRSLGALARRVVADHA